MATINSIWSALMDRKESISQTIDPDTDLTQQQLDEIVSPAIDEVNETNNPNLPARPNG